MKNYYYLTSCVNSTCEDIDYMVERSRKISYKTFLKYVDIEFLKMFNQYSWGKNKNGLKLKDDYSVSFYKSVWRNGKKCVYMEHSRIEYVFIEN